MTGCATLLEFPVVGVLVAVVALGEGDALVSRLAVRSRGVALLALYRLVFPGKRIARLGVIEGLGNIFPIIEIVAGLALRAEPSLVKILVAGPAGLGDADEGAVEILRLNQGAHRRGNVFRGMAFLTLDTFVLSFEQIARLFMIEGLGVPLDDGEIDTVVVGVALRTSLAGAGGETIGEVQALVGGEALCDLGVTFQALEGCFAAGQLVAVDAMGSAFKIFMRTSQRTGRDLSPGGAGQKNQGQNQRSLAREHGN